MIDSRCTLLIAVPLQAARSGSISQDMSRRLSSPPSPRLIASGVIPCPVAHFATEDRRVGSPPAVAGPQTARYPTNAADSSQESSQLASPDRRFPSDLESPPKKERRKMRLPDFTLQDVQGSERFASVADVHELARHSGEAV